MSILILFLKIVLFILAFIFTYYSIKKATMMKGSKGRQILALGGIFSIIASIFDILDTIFFWDKKYYLLILALWVIAIFLLNFGGISVLNRVLKVYHGSLKSIMLKDQSMAHGIFGSWAVTFIGIPIYILNGVFFSSPASSWLEIVNAFVWILGFAILTLSAGWNCFSKSRQLGEIDSEIFVENDVLVVHTYSKLLNNFILEMNVPATEIIEETIIRYFELNPIIFEDCHISQDGKIDFNPALRNISRIGDDNGIQDIITIFSALSMKIFNLYSAMTSSEHTQRIFTESFKAIEINYADSPALYDILRSFPDGILEDERISLLPREELEAKVRERTKELEESRNYINNIIESMSDMLIVVDENRKIKTINQAVQGILGYREDEILDQSFDIIFSTKSIGNILVNSVDNMNKGNLSQNLEINLLSKKGTEVSVFLSSSALYDEYGIFQGSVFIVHDISERKIMENALRESEEKYRLVVENANDAIIVVQDGKLVFTNPKVTEIIGYTREELISRSFVKLIHPDDREMVSERYKKRLMGENVPSSYTFRTITKEGETKWLEINAILINWEDRPATLNFLSDITDKQKMEEGLTRMQKLESVGVLAGGIAHDFNNILTGILGNLSLAKIVIDQKEKALIRLEEAEKATERARSLTQQLLTFSKGGEPILKATKLDELLMESVNFALMGANTICEFSIQDDLWAVIVDTGQISQVISNLIINADQAMPDGGVINVQAKNVVLNDNNIFFLKAGEYAQIIIEDHGAGIPRVNLPKIFDPYFTTKQKGSGLGLTIAHSIIKKHNGHIFAESEEKKGTKFCIYLPASSKDVMEANHRANEKTRQGNGKILIMDDEEMIRVLVQTMLENVGYDVCVASDGLEAIEIYKEAQETGYPFDAVIMDLTIPGGIGGKETIKKLIEIDPNAKAIVSSGYSDDPVMSNFREYGFIDVIAKPYKINELSGVVQRVVNG